MALPNDAALSIVSDEAIVAIQHFEQLLDSGAGSLGLAKTIAESFHAAFEIANCDALTRYSSAILRLVTLWSESAQAADFARLQVASRNLIHFLHNKQQDAAYSELSLYTDYAWLCEQASEVCHPVHLWDSRYGAGLLVQCSEQGLLTSWNELARMRQSHISEAALAAYDINEGLLALLRKRDPEASVMLRTVCDWRSSQAIDIEHAIYDHLLGFVVEALHLRYLELDVVLKRTLLKGLAWLKGLSVGTDEEKNELLFFVFLAWQHLKQLDPKQLKPEALQTSLEQLALLGDWPCMRGINYNHVYLGRFDEHHLAALRMLIAQAQPLWGEASAGDAFKRQGLALELKHTWLRLDEGFKSNFSSGYAVGEECRELANSPDLVASFEVQLEVAAMLLALDNLLQSVHSMSDSAIDDALVDVARRLRCARLGQPSGALEPWMLRQQRHLTQQSVMAVIHQEIYAQLALAETALQRYLNKDEPSAAEQINTARSALSAAQNAAGPLQFAAFDAQLAILLSQVNELATTPQHLGQDAAQGLIHPIAALSLMLDMSNINADAVHTGLPFVSPSAIELPPTAPLELALELPPTDWLDLSPPIPEPISVTEVEAESIEVEPIKSVGHLELPIPLFNAYLSETDEWSRQLSAALTEWSLNDHYHSLDPLSPLHPLHSQTLTWAHALAGSSATIGFADLAHLAKLTERLIERVLDTGIAPRGLSQVLQLGAEEIRRLLHQFAAGFLKQPDAPLVQQLEHYFEQETVWQPAAQAEVPMPVAPALLSTPSAEDEEIAAIFAEEGQELVGLLGQTLHAWGGDRGNADYASDCLRILHTLKGSARLAQRQELAELAHQMESAIEGASLPATNEQLASYSDGVDRLQAMLTPTLATAQTVPEPAILTEQVSMPVSTLTSTGSPQPLLPPLADTRAILPSPIAAKVPMAASLQLIPAGETLRVKSSIIDRLVNQSGEVMIARSHLEAETTRALHTLGDLGAQAQRLRDLLRELEVQVETQMQSRQAMLSEQAKSFDPLEMDRFTRTQELTRFMAEAVSDITTLQRGLQQSLNASEDDLAAQRRQMSDMQRFLLSTRMVEFNSASERLHRLVRQTSQELGKSAELKIVGGALEMDRTVIERMLPAFEHLLRNAIVHGIETEVDRLAAGKPAQGTIVIELAQTGKDVRVTLQDDGRGIDTQAVLAKATQLSGQAPTQRAEQLIFLTGLSTAAQVTELAGRGVGMDVVRAQVQALGGQIDVISKLNAGTTFQLVLPLTTAVTQVVLVRTSRQLTAIPVNLVQTTLRVKPSEVRDALAKQTIAYGAERIDFFRFASLIQATSDFNTLPDAQTLPVVILQSASKTIAVLVDEVLGSQDAVVKNLGPQLSKLPGLAGMTVLPTGQIVFIYNPVALASVYGAAASLTRANASELTNDENASSDVGTLQDHGGVSTHQPNTAKQAPLVLVVDDSITMRKVLQRLLQREGYRVQQATDGKQALDLLRVERPALVLSDVEMPRMDGFELLKQIRSTERLQDLPVVMITSRIADKHRDHAKNLGANEYLGKPYPEEELIALLHTYAGKAVG